MLNFGLKLGRDEEYNSYVPVILCSPIPIFNFLKENPTKQCSPYLSFLFSINISQKSFWA